MVQSPNPAGPVAEGAVSRISLRDVFVDIFGSLVPGMLLLLTLGIILGTTALAGALVLTLSIKPDAHISAASVLERINGLASPLTIEIVLFLVMASYVLGHSYYSQDLREVDRRSFERLFHLTKRSQFFVRRTRRGPSQSPADDHWVAHTREECDFPYPRIRDYLNHRGLHHLASLVPWHGSTKSPTDSAAHHTKNFINILKIRLVFYHPIKCGAISRNEAHVRLMASTWYMSRLLGKAARGCFVVALLFIWQVWPWGIRHSPVVFGVILFTCFFTLFVTVVCARTVQAIEETIHFQRVQEVVGVLETAYTAFRETPELLSDLSPEFSAQTRIS
jgi:hypothetical protein